MSTVPSPEPVFKYGDHVEKIGGDYTFVGVVVAAFAKVSGARRYVVEDDRGVLHVYSGRILRLATEPTTAACSCEAKKQPHPSRDNGPACTWCGRPAMDPIHDPRRGRILGAEIRAAA